MHTGPLTDHHLSRHRPVAIRIVPIQFQQDPSRRTSWAGCDPLRTNLANIPRSAALNATGRDVVLDITDSFLEGRRGKNPPEPAHPMNTAD